MTSNWDCKGAGRAGLALAMIILGAGVAQAQTSAIGVGKVAPVAPNQGLLGTYYNYGTADAAPPAAAPGSPITPQQADAVQFGQRVDGPLTINFQTNAPPAGVNPGPNNFIVVWTGFIIIPTSTNYIFGISSDDGERAWYGNITSTTPNTNMWVQRGAPGLPGDQTASLPETAGNLPVRIEYEQGNGGTSIQLQWNVNGAGFVDVPVANLSPGPGPSPATVTASPSIAGGVGQITVNWTPAATGVTATNWILSRAIVTGGTVGTYTQIAVQAGTTFVDTAVTAGTVYSYIVQGTATANLLIGTASAGVECSILIAASPNTLQVAENGGTASFTVTLLVTPTGAVTVPISSGTPADLLLTGPAGGAATGTITLTFPNGATGAALSQTVMVTGQQVGTEGNPVLVNVNFGTVTCTDPASPYQNYNSGGNAIAPVVVSIIQDAPGIIVNPPSIATVNGGLPVSFTVQLATTPAGGTGVTLNFFVSDPALATVSPPSTSAAGYNAPVTITVTPLNADPNTTFIGPYSIFITTTGSSDPEYAGLGATVPVFTATSTPPLSKTWGSCGLTGVEGFVPLALAAWFRRRRRARRA